MSNYIGIDKNRLHNILGVARKAYELAINLGLICTDGLSIDTSQHEQGGEAHE